MNTLIVIVLILIVLALVLAAGFFVFVLRRMSAADKRLKEMRERHRHKLI